MDILNMLPLRYYNVEGVEYLLRNLTANINVSEKTKLQTQLFLDYRLQPNETARSISGKLYDDPNLYWTIYLINNITNIVEDWPRKDFEDWLEYTFTREQLEEVVSYADSERNSVDITGIRYQYSIDDLVTDSQIILDYNLTPITREDFLRMEQEQKRNIRLLDPDYIDAFVETVKSELS